MWYIFNAQNTCIATCSQEPNTNFLSEREETAIESPENIQMEEAILIDGVVTQKPPHIPTIEEKMAAIRAERDRLLAESDKYMVPDYPITDELREQWRIYRQALRDFPAVCDVDNPVWPEQPQ